MRLLPAIGLAVLLSSASTIAQGVVPATITVDPVGVLSADHSQVVLTGTLVCDVVVVPNAKFGVQLIQFAPDGPVLVGLADGLFTACDGLPHAWTLVANGAFTPGQAIAVATINNNGNTGGSTSDITLIDPPPPPPPLPTSKDQCKKGGWESFGIFKNQGDCVSFVATGGKNSPGH
jgi:hypothetical protein